MTKRAISRENPSLFACQTTPIRLARSTRLFLGRCARIWSAFSARPTNFTKLSTTSSPLAPAADPPMRCPPCSAPRPLPRPSRRLLTLCLALYLRPCRAALAHLLRPKWPAVPTQWLLPNLRHQALFTRRHQRPQRPLHTENPLVPRLRRLPRRNAEL